MHSPECRQAIRQLERANKKLRSAWIWFYVSLSISIGWGLFWVLYALIHLRK